jgi:hypothetical protein
MKRSRDFSGNQENSGRFDQALSCQCGVSSTPALAASSPLTALADEGIE